MQNWCSLIEGIGVSQVRVEKQCSATTLYKDTWVLSGEKYKSHLGIVHLTHQCYWKLLLLLLGGQHLFQEFISEKHGWGVQINTSEHYKLHSNWEYARQCVLTLTWPRRPYCSALLICTCVLTPKNSEQSLRYSKCWFVFVLSSWMESVVFYMPLIRMCAFSLRRVCNVLSGWLVRPFLSLTGQWSFFCVLSCWFICIFQVNLNEVCGILVCWFVYVLSVWVEFVEFRAVY